jgi:hypothetical protein
MRRTRPWPLIAFVAWTVFVWAGRIRNGGSVLLAATFLVLAALVLVVWREHKRRAGAVTALTLWTIGVWAVRTPYILVHDHSVGFKAVHTVLAAVSIGLAVSAQRHIKGERKTATSAARL